MAIHKRAIASIAGGLVLAFVLAGSALVIRATPMSGPGAPSGISAMFVDHEPGGWPPGDQQSYYDQSHDSFDAHVGPYLTVVTVYARPIANPSAVDYSVSFVVPSNEQLRTGTFDGASSGSGADGNQLRTSESAISCSSMVSRFTILEWNMDGTTLNGFAARWESHCGARIPAVFGEVRYQSTVPVAASVLAPTVADFPQSGATQTFTVINPGTVAQSIAARIDGMDAADFQVTHTDCATLDVGASCSVTVTFTSSEAGPRTAELAITDQTARAVRTAVLNGTGLSPTTVELISVAASPVADAPFEVVARVASPEGLVAFLDENGDVLATAAVDDTGRASAAITLPVGTHWVIASATGNDYGRTESTPIRVIVSP